MAYVYLQIFKKIQKEYTVLEFNQNMRYLLYTIKKHLLLITFLLLQTLMVILAIGDTKGIESVHINEAILLHILLTLVFCFGYFCLRNLRGAFISARPTIECINHRFFYISYGLVGIGVFVSVLSVAVVVPLNEYVTMLINYDDYFQDLRKIKHTASTQGLSGAIKVFAYAPLGVFFFSSSLKFLNNIPDFIIRRRIAFLIVISAVGSLLKVSFSMDRLSLLGILIVIIFALPHISKKYRVLSFVSAAAILIFLSYITSLKMQDLSVWEFLRLYCKLGLSNFQLELTNGSGYSYGFNSFLMPLYFIAKFFGYPIAIPQSNLYIWDNAHYLYGYLYMDFKMFSFPVVFLLGIITSKYQQMVNTKHTLALGYYFLALFTICTFIVVPIIRSVEFWFMILLCALCNYLVNKNFKR